MVLFVIMRFFSFLFLLLWLFAEENSFLGKQTFGIMKYKNTLRCLLYYFKNSVQKG